MSPSEKRFLVAQTLFLGDVILTIPLLQHLRHAYPTARIDVLVRKGVEGLLASHPAVSSVLTYDKARSARGLLGAWRVAQRLTLEGYSIALVLPGSVRSAIAVYLARIPQRIGTDQSSGILLFADKVKFPRELTSSPKARSILFLEAAWRAFGGKNSFVSTLFTDVVRIDVKNDAIHRHVQLLAPLRIPVQESILQPRLYPSQHDEKVVTNQLSDVAAERLIAVSPGSVWATKRWPADRYASLAREFIARRYTVCLVGGGSDVAVCEEIVQSVKSSSLLNACGKLTPLQSAELLKRCRLLVTNDTAPMHLASAVGTPCVAIFGPTVPEFGFAPLGDHHMILERKSLWCRPCTPHGGARCPLGTHECMTGISANEVSQAVFRVLERPVS
jgi:heptosyltransferase-2